MIDPRTAAASYVRTLLEVVDACGGSRRSVLHGLRLDETRLANPGERVSLGIVARMWERGLASTGDPGLGLEVGARARPTSFHVLGQAAMNCATLGEALQLMLRYQRLVSEAGVLSARRQRERTTVEYLPGPGIQLLPAQIEGIVSGLVGQARFLAGRKLAPLQVGFTHPAQTELRRYRDAFGVAPDFGAATTSVVLRASDLALPLPQPDAAMRAVCCRIADTMLESLPPIGFVAGFAQQWLRARPAGAARIEHLAEALASSVRTVQRQLAVEGTSFTRVADAARRDAALASLEAGRTLESTALELGYHDASSLARAVRRWRGRPRARRR
jgi:AraC-like DNA-binding protein